MKYALVHDQRSEAEPGFSGLCPVCGAAMVAKCGETKVWHWAHRGKRQCDLWWEPETDWHRNWKNHFPVEWQEVIQTAEDGEKHIADVKTDQDWVMEFQHSYIKPEERRSREAFYGNMVWVVDGLRRKNDLRQFTEAVRDKRWMFQEKLVATLRPYDCRLVDEWLTSRVPVFFDFGAELDFGEKFQPRGLWHLIPIGVIHIAYITLVEEDFVSWLRKGDFSPQPLIDQMKTYEQERVRAIKAHYASQQMPQRMPMPYKPGKRGPQSFEQFVASRYRARARKRF